LNDPQAERQALNQLVALNPDHAEACRRLIELARTNQDWEATARYARLHLAIDPLVPLPHQALADAAEHLRQPHTAIASYRALLQLDPPNPAEIHFRLARQLHQIGDPTAKRHLLQALEDAPRHRPALQLLLEVASATPDPQVSEPATVPPTAAHAP
jgi:tetratricopeptide (TPR) repeat protein